VSRLAMVLTVSEGGRTDDGGGGRGGAGGGLLEVVVTTPGVVRIWGCSEVVRSFGCKR
jgi:hypothetical protein